MVTKFEKYNKIEESVDSSIYGKTLFLIFKGTYYFDMIINGIKKEEYREIKPFYEKRLDGKSYDTVRLQLGMRKNPPTIYVECKGIEKGGVGNKDWGWVEPCYKIKLGKVLKIDNYKQ